MKFLTPKLKEFYMKDFIDNVLPCTDTYWAIDRGLRDILININKNKNIQTLNSKKAKGVDIGCSGDGFESYILFAVTKEASQKEIRKFARLCKRKHTFFSFRINAPELFESGYEGGGEQIENLGCVTNKEYFNISVFDIRICDENLEYHNEFWTDLNNFLSAL